MSILSSLDQIEALYAAKGGLNYGEGISQMEHALQCAVLAQEAGEPDSLVIASLLHDIGHLEEDEAEVVQFERDDRHEITGVRMLSRLFGPEVLQPIALHVAAKRYLCWKDPDYHAALSPASQATLRLQGGVFDADQAQKFERAPFHREAIALRSFDDTGKRPEAAEVKFSDYIPMMRKLIIPSVI